MEQQQPIQQTTQSPVAAQVIKNGKKTQTNKKRKNNQNNNSRIQFGFALTGSIIVLIIVAVLLNLITMMLRERALKQKKINEESLAKLVTTESVSPETVTLLNSVFSGNADVISFINSFENLKQTYESVELSFTEDTAQGEKAPYYLPFTLRIKGDKDSLIAFVNTLYLFPKAIEFNTVELTQDEKSETGGWQLLVMAKLYVNEELKK
jgi:Tfp pilus assembly protein PilO